ncbi:MAG: selenium metabolism-associated LysR family transcriptional regulator [Desulfomonilaceae bacterium]|nr:selenium metabolism-associated LysR family transcriptional regulator [Desulfomonilaceae bacterium]
MDMRRLEVFCKVVELKSFTGAAKALSLSQPTVSEHIRTLEEIVNERLLDRLGREVLATPAGKVFYQYARNIVRMRDEAVQALEQFKGNLAGRLVLGASTIPGTYMLPRIIGDFKSTHPAIQITLRIADTALIVEQVLDGDLEAGFIGSKWSDRRLVMEEIFTDELVLAVYPEHPWASRKRIKRTDLEGEPFILRERGSGTRMVMERILDEHGFDVSRLSVVAEMGSTEAVRQGIKSKIGISILSRNAAADDIDHGLLAAVDIERIRFTRPLYLIQRRNRQMSPLCAAFLERLREHDG